MSAASVADHNTDSKPFIWIKSAGCILQKVICANNHLSFKQNATLYSLLLCHEFEGDTSFAHVLIGSPAGRNSLLLPTKHPVS